MRKTFRMVEMALMAILMCVNFASCSSDDEGDINNQKKLVQIKEVDSDSETCTFDFSYDSKGKLKTITDTDKYNGQTETETINFIWGENTVSQIYDDGEETKYTIANGLITSSSNDYEETNSFTYNTSDEVIRYKGSWGSENFTWENGNLVKRIDSDDKSEITITYGNQTCKGYLPILSWLVEDDCLAAMAHPELLGMRKGNLPTKMTEKGYGTEEYTYTFKDGYVETCTVKEVEYGRTYTTTYTFKWE